MRTATFVLLLGMVGCARQPATNSAAYKHDPKTGAPIPIYLEYRNDYVCPEGWTPGGAWGEKGVSLNPGREIICKKEAK